MEDFRCCFVVVEIVTECCCFRFVPRYVIRNRGNSDEFSLIWNRARFRSTACRHEIVNAGRGSQIVSEVMRRHRCQLEPVGPRRYEWVTNRHISATTNQQEASEVVRNLLAAVASYKYPPSGPSCRREPR